MHAGNRRSERERVFGHYFRKRSLNVNFSYYTEHSLRWNTYLKYKQFFVIFFLIFFFLSFTILIGGIFPSPTSYWTNPSANLYSNIAAASSHTMSHHAGHMTSHLNSYPHYAWRTYPSSPWTSSIEGQIKDE